MTEWPGVLLAHASVARQILRKLLADRVRFIPEDRNGVSGWRMVAEGTVQPLLTGRVDNGVVQKEWRALPFDSALRASLRARPAMMEADGSR